MTFSEAFRPKQLFGPNGLTLFRALSALVLPLWILSNSPSDHVWAAFLFAAAAFSDLFDGLIARQFKLESSLGRFIDPLADKMLTLGLMGAFALRGFYSPWLLAPIFAREILVTFFRIGWLLEGKSIGSEALGKIKHGFQTALLSSSILWMVSQEIPAMNGSTAVFKFLEAISLAGSIFLSVYSGFSFCRNNRALFQSPFFAKYVCAMGVGLLKPAPGTWGSALACVIILLCAWNSWLYVTIGLLLAGAGFWAFQRLSTDLKDPGFVVLDEACGMFVTLAFLPMTPSTVIAGFFLFRFFDIVKPFPLRQLEKIPGFWGVLLDDLGAGVYAWLCVWWFFVRG